MYHSSYFILQSATSAPAVPPFHFILYLSHPIYTYFYECCWIPYCRLTTCSGGGTPRSSIHPRKVPPGRIPLAPIQTWCALLFYIPISPCICDTSVNPNSAKPRVETFKTTFTTPPELTLVTSRSSFCAVNLDSLNSGGAFNNQPKKLCAGADAVGTNIGMYLMYHTKTT